MRNTFSSLQCRLDSNSLRPNCQEINKIGNTNMIQSASNMNRRSNNWRKKRNTIEGNPLKIRQK